ncbi:hypothetical protein [Archaeoglobus fulgidus]
MLAIEEPELYLHPHGRHFYKILKELSQKDVQVIYTNLHYTRKEFRKCC